jgi:hypothetical protein
MIHGYYNLNEEEIAILLINKSAATVNEIIAGLLTYENNIILLKSRLSAPDLYTVVGS